MNHHALYDACVASGVTPEVHFGIWRAVKGDRMLRWSTINNMFDATEVNACDVNAYVISKKKYAAPPKTVEAAISFITK